MVVPIFCCSERSPTAERKASSGVIIRSRCIIRRSTSSIGPSSLSSAVEERSRYMGGWAWELTKPGVTTMPPRIWAS